jgi:hypothetical protein
MGRKLLSGSSIEGVLLSMPPLSAEQMSFDVGGNRVDILWVVPLTRGELAYARKSSVQALEDLLEARDIDISDLYREDLSY